MATNIGGKTADRADTSAVPTPCALGRYVELNLLVVGHTDNVGGYDYNMKLSDRRAAAVVQALSAQHGIDIKRLREAGVGMLAPVATNDPSCVAVPDRRCRRTVRRHRVVVT